MKSHKTAIRFIIILALMLFLPLVCFALEVKQIELEVGSGAKVAAGIAKPEGQGPFPAVILSRGRSGSLDQFKKALPRFAKNGFIAIAIDSNVGKDDIHFSAKTIIEVIESVKKMSDVIPDRVGIWGVSNGGAAVLSVIQQRQVAAAVVYGATYQWAPETAVLTSSPLLLLHGSLDEIIPPDLAKKYHEAACERSLPVSLKIMEGNGHSWDSDSMTASIAFFKDKLIGIKKQGLHTEIVNVDGKHSIPIAIYLPQKSGPNPAVVFQRGRKGSVEQYANVLKRYSAEGFVAVAIDASVFPNHIAAASDRIKSVIDVLKTMKEVRPDKIGLWGLSNGGAAALTYAESNKISALAVYGAIVKLAPNARNITGQPTLFLHGTRDDIASIDEASKYAESVSAVNKFATFKAIAEKGHTWDSDIMTESLEFFKKYLQ